MTEKNNKKNKEENKVKRNSSEEEEEMEQFLKKMEIQNIILKKIIEKIDRESDKSNK